MTKGELKEFEFELNQIESEMVWRDPIIERYWFDWAKSRANHCIKALKNSLIIDSGLSLVNGGVKENSMNALKIVNDRTSDFCQLIENVEMLLGSEAASSGGHMEISRSTFSGLLAIYIENLDNDMSCRIIFDPHKQHASKQGIHTTLECTEYELCEKLDEADSQGFDTLWVHQ